LEKPYEIKIVESEDGSHTLFHTGLNETYHSMHGAVQESEHVFIQAGLEQKIPAPENTLHIFEVGFGTGLNAWLTYKRVAGTDLKVVYHSIEPFPLGEEIYSKLNYVQTTEDEALRDFFSTLHKAPWNEEVTLNSNFTLKKIKSRLEEYQLPVGIFDIIYYDAFAPSKQAEMWLPENIQKAHALLNKGGLLVTYCARGQFKRDLKAVGFLVETLPGPPGKKEMTRGVK
jgi:tRNA U34 5-methylaminomethyl-2-thiouridine-forming methyltransferase MnmC